MADDDCGEICWAVVYVVLFVLVIVGSFRTLGDPVYHVAIDGVAGLNPATDLSRPTVDPKFDLRVRIEPGLWGRGEACLELGSAVTVSYGRVPLATAAVPSRICAGPAHGRGAGTVSVVATGSGVRLPLDVQYALAWELWGWGFGPAAGTAEFDVTLTAPCEGRWKMVSCKTRVGDAAALYNKPCNATVVGTIQQAPLQVAAV